VAAVLIFVVVALLVGARLARHRTPRGPRLLNEPTRAREVRPFSTAHDARFDPLPLEPEKHGK